MPYLPNLSSPDGIFYSKSIQVLQREINRCSELGIKYLVLHFGSHMGTSIEAGKERITFACNKSLQATGGLDVRLLLENSADPKSVGSSFKTIGEVLELVKDQERIGVCLDTCHAFASGYDLTSVAAVQKTLNDFDSSIGLSNLYLIHLNDSKGKLGFCSRQTRGYWKGKHRPRRNGSDPHERDADKAPRGLGDSKGLRGRRQGKYRDYKTPSGRLNEKSYCGQIILSFTKRDHFCSSLVSGFHPPKGQHASFPGK